MNVAGLRQHARELGFSPADQVRWFTPGELVRTAIEVLLSSTFAGYIDRREVQAALPSDQIPIALAGQGLWLDYVADVGDGFDPTYTVARLIAAPELEVSGAGDGPGGTVRLPRGAALVMGGDEVYPTPSARGYEDRTRGPYRAALPKEAEPGGTGPLLLALPGNHDWYDGLTAFLRLFCQRRPIGGWRTEQTRSYFAARLPDRWWLVGVDTQLGTYIDEPQIAYFRRHLSSQLQPGDAVIVCAPAPTWVKADEDHPDVFNSLHWFEQNVIREHVEADLSRRPTGAEVRLWLSGDLHHYARYAEEVPGGAVPGQARQFITCGLGGAYLTETHALPESVELPHPMSRMALEPDETRTALRRQKRYPDPELTRMLSRRIVSPGSFGLPIRNPGFWRLCGTVHAALMLALVGILALEIRLSPVQALRQAGWSDVARMAGQTGLLAGVLALFYLVARVIRRGRPRAPMTRLQAQVVVDVLAAAVLQGALAFGVLAGVVQVPWPGWPGWVLLTLLLIGYLVVVGLVAAYGFALSMLLARSRLVQSWRMVALAIEDHKGFLRLQFAPDGAWVRVHPVVVDRVHRDWTIEAGHPVPVGDLPRPRLVETPVQVNRSGARPVSTPQTAAEPGSRAGERVPQPPVA